MATLRKLLHQKRQDKWIDHPYATHNPITGVATCTICSLPIKSELFWDIHVQSPGHKLKAKRVATEHNQHVLQKRRYIEDSPSDDAKRVKIVDDAAVGADHTHDNTRRQAGAEVQPGTYLSVADNAENDQVKAEAVDDVIWTAFLVDIANTSAAAAIVDGQTYDDITDAELQAKHILQDDLDETKKMETRITKLKKQRQRIKEIYYGPHKIAVGRETHLQKHVASQNLDINDDDEDDASEDDEEMKWNMISRDIDR